MGDFYKARSGRYEDTSENRRKNRVGQQYGQPSQGGDETARHIAAIEKKLVHMKQNSHIFTKMDGGQMKYEKAISILERKVKELRGKQGQPTNHSQASANPAKVNPPKSPKVGKIMGSETTKVQNEVNKPKMIFPDIPNAEKVNLKKYLSNKNKSTVDTSWENIEKIESGVLQKMHDGLVNKFNEDFQESSKSARATNLYSIMRVKAELTKRPGAVVQGEVEKPNKKDQPTKVVKIGDYNYEVYRVENKDYNEKTFPIKDFLFAHGWHSEEGFVKKRLGTQRLAKNPLESAIKSSFKLWHLEKKNMHDSLYNYFRNNAPVLKIKENAKEVFFTTYSVMRDNKAYIHLKQNEDGKFQMSGRGRSLSGWQMEYKVSEIERAADKKNWSEVIKMINSGTAVIGSVQSR